jgi:hypothetical protein
MVPSEFWMKWGTLLNSRKVSLARLDYRLDGVAEGRDDVESDGGLAGEGAKAAHGIGYPDPGELAYDAAANPLEKLLRWGKVLDLLGLTVTDHDVGIPVEDRLHKLRDVPAVVLIVSVGVDDDVGAKVQARLQAVAEAPGKALVALVAHDVVDADLACHVDGAVGAAVVDDEELDRVDPLDLARDVRHRLGQRVLLVVAGDLDDKLQGVGPALRVEREADYTEAQPQRPGRSFEMCPHADGWQVRAIRGRALGLSDPAASPPTSGGPVPYGMRGWA